MVSRIAFIVFAGTLFTFAVSGTTLAQLRDWNSAGGGAYGNAAAWSDANVPDTAAETARFRLNSTYTVDVTADYTVGDLLAQERGNVTFAFSPPSTFVPRKNYNATNLILDPTAGGGVDLSFTSGNVNVSGNTFVGQNSSFGQANLHLLSANLNTAGATVAHGASSAARVVIDDVSVWNATGPLVLGGAGDAELEIQASARTSCFVVCITTPRQGVLASTATILADAASSNVVATNFGVWNTGDFTVGNAGSAEITLMGKTVGVFPGYPSAGTLDSTNVSIGAQAGSSGTVHMAGWAFFSNLYSDWDVTGSLVVGGTPTQTGGTGRLDIELGNDVSVGTTFRMWSTGTLALSKGAILNVTGTARLAGTLEFDITDMTTPQLNDTFQLLTAGNVVGTFGTTILPPLGAGLNWSVQYAATNVSLKVIAGPNGDFNNDGIVDAADYVVWREGVIVESTPANYAIWRAKFGTAVDGAGASLRAVPEPASAVLMAVVAAVGLAVRRSTRQNRLHG
jgi:hypothetical protein